MNRHLMTGRLLAFLLAALVVAQVAGAQAATGAQDSKKGGDIKMKDALSDKVLLEIQQREREERERKEILAKMARIRQRLAQQFRDNDRWETEVREKESDLVREGEELFEKKDYRKAKKRYLDAVEIRYLQWVFDADFTAFIKTNKSWYKVEDREPSCKKRRFPLSTEFTRLALTRLANIDTLIDEYDLAMLRIRADKAFEEGKLGLAYARYGDVIDLARKMGTHPLALQYVKEVDLRREDIIEVGAKPLDVAKTSLEAGNPTAALAALDEFRKEHSDLLFIKEIKRVYNALSKRPEIAKERREQSALRIVALGDASVGRKDYRRAVFWYRRVSLQYASTKAGALAKQKGEKLLAQPEIVQAIARQEAESTCKAMLARAETFAGWGKTAEAAAVYDDIIKRYPDTEWAKQAADARAKLPAAKDAE